MDNVSSPPQEIVNPLPQVAPLEPPQDPTRDKKRKKIAIVITVAVLALIAIVIFVAFIFFKWELGITTKAPTPTPTDTFPGPTVSPTPAQNNPKLPVEINLIKNKVTEVKDLSLSLTLKSTQIIDPDKCADCTASTVILVNNNGMVKTITYACGGFGGICNLKQDIGDYNMELLDQSTESAKVKLYSKDIR
jgi:flagellar basal body-associated protein FliL